MKKLVFLFRATFMVALFFACNPNKNKLELIELRNSVIATHDTAMLQMDYLISKSAVLRELAQLSTTNSPDSTAIYLLTAEKLTNAHNLMMIWMRQYKEPSEETPFEDAKAFYISQQKSARIMKDSIFRAIEVAKTLVYDK